MVCELWEALARHSNPNRTLLFISFNDPNLSPIWEALQQHDRGLDFS